MLEVLDGLDEAAFSYGHEHIDRIEVPAAAKASGEIRQWIGRRVELGTDRAEEPQVAFGFLGRKIEIVADQIRNGDAVPQCPQKMSGESFHFHVGRLRQLELAEGIVDEGLIYLLQIASGGIDQAGGGYIVDLSRNTSRKAVDQSLGLRLHFTSRVGRDR